MQLMIENNIVSVFHNGSRSYIQKVLKNKSQVALTLNKDKASKKLTVGDLIFLSKSTPK